MHKSLQAFYDRKYATGTEIFRTSKQYGIDCVPDRGNLEILDVGCGAGTNSAALAAMGHTVMAPGTTPVVGTGPGVAISFERTISRDSQLRKRCD